VITPLPAGSVFAGYQVDAVLARGGMGVVYLATEQRPHRRIALKLIAPALAADPAYRERFLREVDALAALEHPHVVPIHAAGEWEGQLYLAMRYLDGPDLAEVVRTAGPLAPAEAIGYLAPIADALDMAHGRGIVHRDVTPANIRLDSRGTPYLTDFGLTKRAATAGDGALTLGPMGTPAYMAPEQFSGDGSTPAPDPALAPRADVYALGCVLVTLLTGSPPYPRDSYEAALWAHVHAEPPRISERRPDLPEGLDAVVARALAKEPAARFTTAGALVEAARAELAAPSIVASGAIAAASGAARTTAIAAPAAGGPASGGPPAGAPPGGVRAGAAPRSAAAPAPPRRTRSTAAVVGRTVGALLLLVLITGSGIGAGLLLAGTVGPGLLGLATGESPDPTSSPRPTAKPTPPPTPTPSPTPTPTPEPTPTPTPTPEPTPRLGAAEDVSQLRAWIPRPVRNSCVSRPLRSNAEIAALTCDADDADEVRYVLYRDAATMAERWRGFAEQAAVEPGGRCEAGQEMVGTWSDEGLFGLFGEVRGDLACTVGGAARARVDWTTVDAPIWATLWRGDEDIASAYATWSKGRLNPLREPR
jgi:serine/threonine-protein kinase